MSCREHPWAEDARTGQTNLPKSIGGTIWSLAEPAARDRGRISAAPYARVSKGVLRRRSHLSRALAIVSHGDMQADEFRTGVLALARSASDAVTRYLTGQAEPGATLTWVMRACEALRRSARDEVSQHLISLIDLAALRLYMRVQGPKSLASLLEDADSREIVLVSALEDLEVHLRRLSLVH